VSVPSVVCEIANPAGVWTDVSGRVDLETLGGVNLGVEDGLLQFRTGDFTLGFHNNPEFFRSLFSPVDPSLAWRLRFYRDSVKYFEGIIRLPSSVRFNDVEALCEITAFGYLKLLDGTSAESVKRTFGTITAQGTAGASNIALNNTAGLTQDDQLRLADDVNSETVTILRVTDASNVIITGTLVNTWPALTSVEMLTPYYRRQTIPFLVGKLFTAGGIASQTVDLSGADFDLQIATPFNTDGLGTAPTPASVTNIAGKIRVRLVRAGVPPLASNVEYEAVSAASGGFAVAGTSVGSATQPEAIVDWKVYEASEPSINVAGNEASDLSNPAIAKTIYGGVDYDFGATPSRFGCVLGQNGIYSIARDSWSTGIKTFTLAFTRLIENQATGQNQSLTGAGCDYDPVRNHVYVCYASPGGTSKLGYVLYSDGGTGFTGTLKTGSGAEGQLRYNRQADIVLHLAGTALTAYRNGLQIYTATLPTSKLRLRSMRYLTTSQKWVGIVQELDRTKLFIATRLFETMTLLDFAADSNSTKLIANDSVNDSDNMLAYGLTLNQAVGVIDKQYVVVDSLYAGVVSYADFSGKTCAQAIAELAVLTNAVTFVDANQKGYFVSRTSLALQPPGGPKALDALVLTDEGDLVWEKWFGVVTVTSGALSVTLGDASLAAGALEVEAAFVPNLSVASSLAAAFKAFYGRSRRARRVTVHDDGTVYTPLQPVTLGGATWTVYEVDHNLGDYEVALALVEIV